MQSNKTSSLNGFGLLSQDVTSPRGIISQDTTSPRGLLSQDLTSPREKNLKIYSDIEGWNLTSTDISPRDNDLLSSSQSSTGSSNDFNSSLISADMYPEWKQQVLQRKEEKRKKEIQRAKELERLENERKRLEEEKKNSIPYWKRELLEKKQWKDFEKATDDDITSRRNSIAAIENELSDSATAIWQRELLEKRKERLEVELKLIQLRRDEDIEKIKQNMTSPYTYLNNKQDKVNIYE